MRLIIREDADDVSVYVARYIIDRIREYHPTPDRPFVLGLPTGSSPLGVYKILVSKYKQGEVSFENVVTFNMDEYIGIPRDDPQSYHTFMWTNFFSHVNIHPSNVHIPDGNAPDLAASCAAYEDAIRSVGGIDLFLCGVGSDGHVAFNEPGSSLASRTRVKTLARDTVLANARFFDGDLRRVPKMAVTVGVRTVLEAREVVVVVTGVTKALALQKCVEEGVNHMWTLSSLQLHPHPMIVCDEDATQELRVKTVKYFKSIEIVARSQGFELVPPPTLLAGMPSPPMSPSDPLKPFPATTVPLIHAPVPMSPATQGIPMRSASPDDLVPDRMASRLDDPFVAAGRLTPRPAGTQVSQTLIGA